MTSPFDASSFGSGSSSGYVRVPFDAADAPAGGDGARTRPSAADAAEGDVVSAKNVEVNDVAAGETGADAAAPVAQVVIEDARGNRKVVEVPIEQKVKGAVQMAGGAVMVAAGVPMCVLPGPGVAFIAGGAALASKGQRNFSGRDATPIEEKLDDTAQKLGAVAKEQAQRAARTAAEKAPEVAEKAARTVAEKGPEVAGKVVKATVDAAPKVAKAAAKAAPKVAGAAVKAAKAGIGFISRKRSK